MTSAHTGGPIQPGVGAQAMRWSATGLDSRSDPGERWAATALYLYGATLRTSWVNVLRCRLPPRLRPPTERRTRPLRSWGA
ncbi:hypothetical protein ACW9HF_29190 [Nocardia gipuzkoensis]